MSWRPFAAEEEAQIVAAIASAERGTSGEIRVHIDRYCKNDPLLKARNLFVHLGMEKTERSNGVIIYVSVEDRKFAIYGDKGINEKVGEGFWTSTAAIMAGLFKEGKIAEGIAAGVKEAGEKLREYFPVAHDDTNELTNDISYS